MTDEQLKKFQDSVTNADTRLTEIEKSLKGKITTEDLKVVSDAVEDVKGLIASIENIEGKKITEYIKATQEHANKLEQTIADMKEGFGIKELGIKTKVKNLVTSDDFKNHCKELKTSRTGRQFEIEKAANDLLTSDWTADTGAVGLPQLQLPGVTKHPWRNTPVFAAVGKRTVGMDHQVSYTEELSRSDAAALKAEGSQYAQSGATWITKVLSFFDIGHYVKVTRESLEDAEYIQQEMNDLLSNGLLRALEVLLVSGAGTTTIKGVYTSAKTFAKVPGTKAVSNPSFRDILGHAKLFVKKGYNATASNDTNKTGYMANLALLGPAAGYAITTEKDEIGRPLVDNLDTYRPYGLGVVESEDLTESDTSKTFVVGDFNKAMLYMKRNLIIETGYDGNDFTYGMVTLRASLRGNLLIKSLEEYAFVKGDFETAGGLISV